MRSKCCMQRLILIAMACCLFSEILHAQQATVTIDIKAALERARTNSPQFQSASIAVDLARIDSYLARTAYYPSVNYNNQFIYNQGNGSPEGTFIGGNGVREYISQGVVREDIVLPGRKDEYKRSIAAETVAAAKRDVALQGIVATVFQNYYGIVAAQRHLSNAQQSLEEARRLVRITEKLESGGEVAHSDVLKAQLTMRQRERDVQDGHFAVKKNKIALAVLIFPDFTTDYAVADDLASAPPLETFDQIQALAKEKSPDLRAAQATISQEEYGKAIARNASLPTVSVEYLFGIDSPKFAIHDEEGFRRIGSAAQATLTIPLFNWGATRNKVRQAELKLQQAQLDLTLTQRELNSNLRSSYLEAEAAFTQLDSLKQSVDLSAESLRLINLRYEAGESSILEVVDAQTALAQARNAHDDGLSRYRLALSTIQTLTGNY
jgi:outer membrane protein TolC